jgi:hypothetical protein
MKGFQMKEFNLIIKTLLLFSLLTVFNYSASAQDGNAIIKTDDGFLLINNDSSNQSFMLELKGQTLSPIESSDMAFTIDGKFVQIISVAQSDFINADSKTMADAQILETYSDWKIKYLIDTFKGKLDVKGPWTTMFTAIAGRTAFFWSCPIPEQLNPKVKEQLFLTMILGNKVIGLKMVIEKDTDKLSVLHYMCKSLDTIKISQEPFDIKAISEMVQQGKKP